MAPSQARSGFPGRRHDLNELAAYLSRARVSPRRSKREAQTKRSMREHRAGGEHSPARTLCALVRLRFRPTTSDRGPIARA